MDDEARRAGRRVLSVLLGIWFALTLTFALFQTGDLSRWVSGRVPDEVRAELGLDRSIAARYVSFLTDTLRGDLGHSFASGKPVIDLVRPALVRSTALLFGALVVALALARLLAGLSMRRPGGGISRWIVGLSSALSAVPAPYTVLALVILSLELPGGVLRIGNADPDHANALAGALDVLHHAVLPALAIVLLAVGRFTLGIREGMSDRLDRREPGTRDGRPNGIGASFEDSGHVLAAEIGVVVSILIITEWFAGRAGVGYLGFVAGEEADLPLVQGVFLALAVPAIVVACLGRSAWVRRPACVERGPARKNRAIVIGSVVTLAWVSFALLAPVVLPAEQRTREYARSIGAPPYAPPFGSCSSLNHIPCAPGERRIWLLGTDADGVSNLQIAWDDRRQLGYTLWALAPGLVLGVAAGGLIATGPRRLRSGAAWVVDMSTTVPFIAVFLALPFVSPTTSPTQAGRLAFAVIGVALIARPLSEAWSAGEGWATRDVRRALIGGAARFAAFVTFAAATADEQTIMKVTAQVVQAGSSGPSWLLLGVFTLNVAAPILGLGLIGHGLLARRRAAVSTDTNPSPATEAPVVL